MGDIFILNEKGIVVECPSAPGSSAFTISNAHFRLQRDVAFSVACPIAVKARGLTFEDGQGPALSILGSTDAGAIDLGGGDAGNVFQSTSHPSRTGICLQTPGTVDARGNGFAHCPTQSSANCAAGDISTTAGGTIDTSGCVVVP
jgi:hypothetical protein